MSDVFEGPGWWMASDGKWYPPEGHPDAHYRSRFLPQAVVAAPPAEVEEPSHGASLTPDAVHTQSIAGAVTGNASNGSAPDVADVPGGGTNLLDRAAHDTPFADASFAEAGAVVPDVRDLEPVIPEVTIPALDVESSVPEVTIPALDVESSVPEVAIPAPEAAAFAPALEHEAPAVRVSKDELFEPAPEVERPTFPPRIPPSVSQNSDVQIELGREDLPTEPNSLLSVGSTTTDVVVVGPAADPGVPIRDRITASLIFLSGIAMIVGTFLTWIPGDIPESGWDRGEGFATIIAGIAGSAAAGPIFVGFRHAIPKAAAIIGGLVGLVVIGLVSISSMDGGAGTLGIGLIVVGAAAAAMLLAGIVQPSHDDNW